MWGGREREEARGRRERASEGEGIEKMKEEREGNGGRKGREERGARRLSTKKLVQKEDTARHAATTDT